MDLLKQLTELRLKDIEKNISKIYQKHSKKIEKMYLEYFSQFAKEDEEKRKKVKDGELTEKEYKNWCVSTMMAGRKWDKFLDEVAKEMMATKVEALDYANSKMSVIYADNYNYINYKTEVIENGEYKS